MVNAVLPHSLYPRARTSQLGRRRDWWLDGMRGVLLVYYSFPFARASTCIDVFHLRRRRAPGVITRSRFGGGAAAEVAWRGLAAGRLAGAVAGAAWRSVRDRGVLYAALHTFYLSDESDGITAIGRIRSCRFLFYFFFRFLFFIRCWWWRRCPVRVTTSVGRRAATGWHSSPR